jgi:D-beta-D-heptose 7-phosphate kinase/D-beta-D-heptose 1-phosphate adenosyltransferase
MAANVRINLEALGCEVDFITGQTCKKTRLIDIRSKQQIVRIDNDIISTPIEFLTSIPTIYDAVVISDYNKGTISYELIESLLDDFSGPIFVDTKKTDLARMEGCVVKINKLEESLAKTYPSDLIVTLGKDGARYKQYTYPSPYVEVSDVCGAGDTFLAALTYKMLDTGKIDEAIIFANYASALTVQHSGVYAPTLEEIYATLWQS